ncbi:hypothetical protein ACU686_22435 [Yinghuangia aomiensis]
MRGTTVRHLWWLRYTPANGVVFWSTVGEYLHLVLGITIPAVLLAVPEYRAHSRHHRRPHPGHRRRHELPRPRCACSP